MRPQAAYAILCVAGTLIPYSQFGPFLLEHGPDVRLIVQELFANRVAAAFGLDVVMSSLALWTLIAIEGRRDAVPHPWAPVVANVLVGVSLGLPLFLWLRERARAARS